MEKYESSKLEKNIFKIFIRQCLIKKTVNSINFPQIDLEQKIKKKTKEILRLFSKIEIIFLK